MAYVVKKVKNKWAVAVEDSSPLEIVFEDDSMIQVLIYARRISKKERTTASLMDEKNRIYCVLDYENIMEKEDFYGFA